MISRSDIEIKDQPHQMWAEGCHDDKPSSEEIISILNVEGFESKGIEIWEDTLQCLWRWHCEILRV